MNKEQVIALVEELKNSKSQGEIIFPWEDVLASMMKHPEEVSQTSVSCPNCGEKIIKIYFSSPAWTWKKLCGRAGDMYICPKCHAQKDFIMTLLS